MPDLHVPAASNADAAQARRAGVNKAWSADTVRDAAVLGQYWLAHPLVKARVNLLASGRADVDPYARLAELLAGRGWPMPVGRAISLGCGFGGLERDLAGRGVVRQLVGLDLAEGAVAEARRLAAAAGLEIRYEVADLEGARLPSGSADVVFAHQAVHHIEDLDGLFLAVRRALRPGGVLHLHEFVGPKRFQWTDAQLALANEFLDSLPQHLRRLPSGAQKGRLLRPTLDAMLRIDPTEAIRSDEIRTVLVDTFDIIEERELGGTLVHIALGDIAQNFDPADADARAALDRLFTMEDQAMADRRIGSDFVTFTAVPRRDTPVAAVRRFVRRARAAHAAGRARPPALMPEPAFDEAWYLDTFPDVREAIAKGVFASGHDHWLHFGKAEGRPPAGAGQTSP